MHRLIYNIYMSKMEQVKCPACGAKIKVDAKNRFLKCEYCGSVLKNDEYVDAAPVPTQPTTPTPTPTKPVYVPPRPRIRVFLVIFLAFFYVWPAVIYIFIKAAQIEEWERKYGKKK